MSNLYGFIITRHVNSAKTNNYWNHCVKLLRTLYPYRKIVIIDDNSNYEYVKAEFEYKNIEIIQSEFKGRGELLPYYYFLKHKFFKNAVIIHDSVFFHKRIAFEKLNGMSVLPLWFFYPDKEDVENRKRIMRYLKNYQTLDSKLSNDTIIGLPHDKWFGCFGVQSYISLGFLERIEHKYGITQLVSAVSRRIDRCCLERILGCIFFTEYQNIIRQKSLFGDIMKYQTWGYSYDEYMVDLKKGTIKAPVVKVWTGR
jgi:hypothetical protein